VRGLIQFTDGGETTDCNGQSDYTDLSTTFASLTTETVYAVSVVPQNDAGSGPAVFRAYVTTTSTRSLLSVLHSQRHGQNVTVHWRVMSNDGLLGFYLVAGGSVLNRKMVPVHHALSYSHTVRYTGSRPITVQLIRK
jgi:hypothetical protein